MEMKRLSGLLNFENIASTTIVLFVIIVLSLPMIISFMEVYANPSVQNIDVQVRVKMRNGGPAIYPRVQIYHLSDQGPRLIASGSGDQSGLYNWRIRVPRDMGNRLYIPELEREVDVYASTNILILAYDEKMSMVGSLAVSVDPSFMKWPFDSFAAELTLTDELPRAVEASSAGVLSVPPPVETWKLTPVIEYAVWDQIWAYAVFPFHSKIDVETKQRVYDPQTNQYLTDWVSIGSTTITLDRDDGHPIITGKQKYTGYYSFKYILCYISIPYTPYYYETVYAADTPDCDPLRIDQKIESWSGSASGSNPFITPQNFPWTAIPVTTTSQWVFSVSVSFGVSLPSGSVSIGVGLSVSRQSIPYGKVNITTGTWLQNYSVYTYGREYGFRKSYSIWEYTGPG